MIFRWMQTYGEIFKSAIIVPFRKMISKLKSEFSEGREKEHWLKIG